MQTARPGEVVDKALYISQIDFSRFQMRISTDRYSSRAYHQRERDLLWMRVWQVAGRADEIPKAGDWKAYSIFDQSYVLVRGKDGQIRGFVNACRHRGNAFCKGNSGHAARFTCPYHNWTYGLDGRLLAVAKPDFDGTDEDFVGDKDQLGLLPVPVECFAGFIFINPDKDAAPLADFLGEVMDLLKPYHFEEMIPVGLNVRESLNCNWKVIMDAFQEGYHVQGIHRELIAALDESKERYSFFGDHSIATAPFGASNIGEGGVELEIEAIRNLPATFPGVVEVLPRFEELLTEHRNADESFVFPAGVTARLLLQQATRETLTGKGLDVSGLTDNQLSDNQFYVLFPNFFTTIRAGEATVIVALPHPDGDPNRCIWHVTNYMWAPPHERESKREKLLEVAEGDHFQYFLALEQDFDQMQRQQDGLRNSTLKELALTKQEVRLAYFHSVLDSWVDGGAKP